MQTPMNRKSATRLLLVQWSKFQNVSVKLEGSTLFTGINGSGKSTLLKCVYRVLSPDKGAVFLDGKPLKDMNYKTSARSLGVVAQHNYYNFDFSVREVVLMGRSPHKKALERDNAEDYAIVAEALKTVGMAEFANRSFFDALRR